MVLLDEDSQYYSGTRFIAYKLNMDVQQGDARNFGQIEGTKLRLERMLIRVVAQQNTQYRDIHLNSTKFKLGLFRIKSDIWHPLDFDGQTDLLNAYFNRRTPMRIKSDYPTLAAAETASNGVIKMMAEWTHTLKR